MNRRLAKTRGISCSRPAGAGNVTDAQQRQPSQQLWPEGVPGASDRVGSLPVSWQIVAATPAMVEGGKTGVAARALAKPASASKAARAATRLRRIACARKTAISHSRTFGLCPT
jgi:hypothetical protein